MCLILRPTTSLATAPIQSNGGGELSCGDGRHLYLRACLVACAGVFSALSALSCSSWASDSVFLVIDGSIAGHGLSRLPNMS